MSIGIRGIVWETKISDLVNVEKVVSIVSDGRKKIEKETNAKIDALELEMTVGGLSKQALMLGDNSPLFDAAKKIVNDYKAQLTFLESLEDEVKEATVKQRKEELTTLKSRVEEKKKELEAKRLKQSESVGGVNNAIDYTGQITALAKKLEQISAELGKL